MARAAQLVSSDLVLEPSAGTGLLAIHAELRGVNLILNELAETRHSILKALFPDAPLSGFNAEHIDDFLAGDITPTAVLMNPPFSLTPHVHGASLLAGFRHVSSALARLSPKGRLVALLSDRFDPSRALPKTHLAPKPVAKPASVTSAAAPLTVESSRGEPIIYRRKTTVEEAALSSDKLYEPYTVQTIAIEGATPHPTALLQSASMTLVRNLLCMEVPFRVQMLTLRLSEIAS